MCLSSVGWGVGVPGVGFGQLVIITRISCNISISQPMQALLTLFLSKVFATVREVTCRKD